MAEGQCNCGNVRFKVKSDLSDVYICHCSNCQNFTGSNGIAVVVCKNKDFHWLAGKEGITSWSRPGSELQRHFCNTCGSALPGANDDRTMFIPAGSITKGGKDLQVAHHIWTESRACWDVIGDDGKKHPEEFFS